MENQWKVVPVEMDENMYQDFCEARGKHGATYKDAYRAMLAAAPVPPAGGDVEVLAVVTLGSFSAEELGEIDIEPKMKALERIQHQVVTNEDVVVELVDLSHIVSLKAEIEALESDNAFLERKTTDLTFQNFNLQSELTKARELLMKTRSVLNSQFWDKWDSLVEVRLGVSDFLAYQSAPAAKGEEYPSAEIAAEAAAGVYDIDFAGPDEEPDANNIPKYIVNGRETDVHPTCPVRGCGKPSCSPWTTCLEHHR